MKEDIKVIKPESYKIVLVGMACVGKSSLVCVNLNHVFTDAYEPTVGSFFYPKEVEVNGQKKKLDIWDTSGLFIQHEIMVNNK